MVSELLHSGKENALTARELAAFMKISPRDISKAIEKERRQGIPICASTDSDNPGYYMARDAGELAAYLEQFDRRYAEIGKTLEALHSSSYFTGDQTPPGDPGGSFC